MGVVDEVSDLLKELWLSEITQHRVSRAIWDDVRGPLGDYPAARHIQRWYTDSVLAGCRRLVDKDHQSDSLYTALEQLRDRADEVTEEVLVEIWTQHDDAAVRQELADQARKTLRGVGVEVDGVLQLDPAAVTADLERLEQARDDIWTLATRTVAHRDPRQKPEVSEEDVDELLATIADMHKRWYQLLAAADPHQKIDHLVKTNTLVLALELFDRDDYAAALSEAERSIGPGEPAEKYEQLRSNPRVEYHFGSGDDLN